MHKSLVGEVGEEVTGCFLHSFIEQLNTMVTTKEGNSMGAWLGCMGIDVAWGFVLLDRVRLKMFMRREEVS